MKNKNGLPLNVIYCEECNLSNQQPTTTNEYFHINSTTQISVLFDKNNVCAACNFNKLKWNQTINWDDREKELMHSWNLTAKTVLHTEDWKKLFLETKYTGDFFWFKL